MYINFAQPIYLPPYWLEHPDVVQAYNDYSQMSPAEALDIPHACPLMIKWKSEANWWQFPIEPVITINGKNNVVKRNVLKVASNDSERRGSVKELWTQDDYEINISGIFISKQDDRLPEDNLRTLRRYCEGREAIEVQSPLFTLFNIRRMVIEDFQFPFTKGMENQMFTLRGCSDDVDDKQLLLAK